MNKVIAIVGPTAVGKTALSIELARQETGEIISGDSMQVYRHLDIGTAKVTPAEMAGVPHHLIDICNVDEQYSAARFKRAANHWIRDIHHRHRLPIITGGTGLYIQSLTDNLALGADQDDGEGSTVRSRWEKVAAEKGNAYLWQRLAQLDPVASAKIPVGNQRRLVRALEVIEKTGRPFSRQPQSKQPLDFLLIGLNTDRQVLYERINARVDQMVDQGLVDEARWLYEQGGPSLPAWKGIGYHEFLDYFTGQGSLAEAIAKVKLDSRHYAKRQLTWFRNRMPVHWFNLVNGQDTIQDVKSVIDDWLIK